MDDVITQKNATFTAINITAAGNYGENKVDNSESILNASATGRYYSDLPNSGVNATTIGYVPEDTGLTTTELVVIGAGVTVCILAVLAVILRIVMPIFRKKNTKKEKLIRRGEVDHIDKKHGGHMNSYHLQPSPVISHSSRSSASQRDCTEIASNQTRSTYYTKDSHHNPKQTSFGNLRGSALSLPVYLPVDKSPRVHHSQGRMNQELVTRLHPPGLDPVKMGDCYRERWDTEFDSYTTSHSALPRNYLSYLAHPSENRRIPDPASSVSSVSSGQRLYGDWSYRSAGGAGKKW